MSAAHSTPNEREKSTANAVQSIGCMTLTIVKPGRPDIHRIHKSRFYVEETRWKIDREQNKYRMGIAQFNPIVELYNYNYDKYGQQQNSALPDEKFPIFFCAVAVER